MKREMSVEMRLGEMEDYKGHIKQDLVSRMSLIDYWSQANKTFLMLNTTEHNIYNAQ